MALVTITGNAWDHGVTVLPANLQQRLWFVPNGGHIVLGAGALDGQPVAVDFNRANGAFTVQVWSTNSDDLWYTLRTDWLPPGQETEPTAERSRSFFEWPQRIFPGEGGALGDLVSQTVGRGIVYCAPDAPNVFRQNQLHYNTDTYDLYERVVTW